MRAFVTVTLMAFLIGACSKPPTPPSEQQVRGQSAEQKQMHGLDEMNRSIALKRAIHSSGYSCKRIERSGYVEEHGNLSMWTAHCSDKRDWAIFIGPDASVQVRPCADMAEFKLPACVIRPAKAPAA